MPEKKSVWDFLDTFLPSATNIYGRIREEKTGVNPFDRPEQPEDDLLTGGTSSTGYKPPAKPAAKNNTIWFVIGGLVVVGAGTYFLIKKYKK